MNGSVSPLRRRHFLLILLGGAGAAVAAAAGWVGLRFLAPPRDGGRREGVFVDPAVVPVGGASFLDLHGRTAVVLQPEPGRFVAFSAICTHLGCVVKWLPEKNEFLCPCHAGRFDAAGQVLGGPPPAPLQTIPVTFEGGRLLVG